MVAVGCQIPPFLVLEVDKRRNGIKDGLEAHFAVLNRLFGFFSFGDIEQIAQMCRLSLEFGQRGGQHDEIVGAVRLYEFDLGRRRRAGFIKVVLQLLSDSA